MADAAPSDWGPSRLGPRRARASARGDGTDGCVCGGEGDQLQTRDRGVPHESSEAASSETICAAGLSGACAARAGAASMADAGLLAAGSLDTLARVFEPAEWRSCVAGGGCGCAASRPACTLPSETRRAAKPEPAPSSSPSLAAGLAAALAPAPASTPAARELSRSGSASAALSSCAAPAALSTAPSRKPCPTASGAAAARGATPRYVAVAGHACAAVCGRAFAAPHAGSPSHAHAGPMGRACGPSGTNTRPLRGSRAASTAALLARMSDGAAGVRAECGRVLASCPASAASIPACLADGRVCANEKPPPAMTSARHSAEGAAGIVDGRAFLKVGVVVPLPMDQHVRYRCTYMHTTSPRNAQGRQGGKAEHRRSAPSRRRRPAACALCFSNASAPSQPPLATSARARPALRRARHGARGQQLRARAGARTPRARAHAHDLAHRHFGARTRAPLL